MTAAIDSCHWTDPHTWIAAESQSIVGNVSSKRTASLGLIAQEPQSIFLRSLNGLYRLERHLEGTTLQLMPANP